MPNHHQPPIGFWGFGGSLSPFKKKSISHFVKTGFPQGGVSHSGNSGQKWLKLNRVWELFQGFQFIQCLWPLLANSGGPPPLGGCEELGQKSVIHIEKSVSHEGVEHKLSNGMVSMVGDTPQINPQEALHRLNPGLNPNHRAPAVVCTLPLCSMAKAGDNM